jgi:TonB family protein
VSHLEEAYSPRRSGARRVRRCGSPQAPWLRASLVAWVALVAVAFAGAADERRIEVECPLCEEEFRFTFVLQEMRSGLRLDFKQFGCVNSPAELPECPRCDLVLPDGGRDELSRDDLAILRELIKSDRYRTSREETSYFRLAVILEALGRPPQDIAFAYVAASWQVDEEPVRCQIYLARALAWYDTYLAKPEPTSPARTRAMLLKAEILRRLARFAEAREFLAEIVHHPAMARALEQNIIQQQRDLVAAKDDEPHVAIADDARVDVTLRVTTPGSRGLRPALTPDTRLPAFPSGPYAARISGAVTVQLSVSRSGYVVGWQVKSATAEAFAKSVLRTVRDWTFDPDQLDGAPSPVQVECVVYFALEG